MAELLTTNEVKNRVITAAASASRIREDPSTDSRVLQTVPNGKVMGTLTGRYADQPDGRWWQFYLARPTDNLVGYARQDVVKILSSGESDSKIKKSKDLISRLVKSDIEVFHSLARCAALLTKYLEKGVDVTRQKKRHSNLIIRYSQRQNKLRTSKLLKTKTGFKSGLRKTVEAFKFYMQTFYGIGAAPVLAVAVVGVAVGAALSITAYFLFRSDYSESTEDLKISKDLEKALMNLDPDAARNLMYDLEGQVDKAYAKGKTAGKFTGTAGMIKMAAIFLLGFFTIDYLNHRQNTKKRR